MNLLILSVGGVTTGNWSVDVHHFNLLREVRCAARLKNLRCPIGLRRFVPLATKDVLRVDKALRAEFTREKNAG